MNWINLEDKGGNLNPKLREIPPGARGVYAFRLPPAGKAAALVLYVGRSSASDRGLRHRMLRHAQAEAPGIWTLKESNLARSQVQVKWRITKTPAGAKLAELAWWARLSPHYSRRILVPGQGWLTNPRELQPAVARQLEEVPF